MTTPQISSGNVAPLQRIPRKPTLLEIINGNRCVTVIRLAQTAGVQPSVVHAVLRDNAATPQVAERIIKGLTKLTNHHYSVLDINLSVHPKAK
jgi:hypothetical protein